jgi:CorA-like Mg2+ transporter protein
LESIQERARLLQEEIASRAFEATNVNLYIFSLFTAIFLPLNLITGIFEMNVAGLPWLENPGGFLWVTCGSLRGSETAVRPLFKTSLDDLSIRKFGRWLYAGARIKGGFAGENTPQEFLQFATVACAV